VDVEDVPDKKLAEVIRTNPLVKKVLESTAEFEIQVSSSVTTPFERRQSHDLPPNPFNRVTEEFKLYDNVEDREERVKDIPMGGNPPEEQFQL
jgi:gamma-glutamyl:cysteine ligase YbdK (ATP-grasp superfamily)